MSSQTAMERLCRELADSALSSLSASVRKKARHDADACRTKSEVYCEIARDDIERRIADARDEDEREDTYSARELKRLTGIHSDHRYTTLSEVVEMAAVAEGRKEKAADLDALRGAGRVMPEGLAWPRYADGTAVALGDVRIGPGGRECRVVGAAAGCGRMSAVCEDADDGGALVLVDPSMLEPPDSWERLTEDARKGIYTYWGCRDFPCTECPAVVDGKRPRDRYGCHECSVAMRLDMLARAKRLAGVPE